MAQWSQVRSLGQEDPLEKEMATHSSILAWRIPMDREDWRATVHGVSKSPTWLSKWACSYVILMLKLPQKITVKKKTKLNFKTNQEQKALSPSSFDVKHMSFWQEEKNPTQQGNVFNPIGICLNDVTCLECGPELPTVTRIIKIMGNRLVRVNRWELVISFNVSLTEFLGDTQRIIS